MDWTGLENRVDQKIQFGLLRNKFKSFWVSVILFPYVFHVQTHVDPVSLVGVNLQNYVLKEHVEQHWFCHLSLYGRLTFSAKQQTW